MHFNNFSLALTAVLACSYATAQSDIPSSEVSSFFPTVDGSQEPTPNLSFTGDPTTDAPTTTAPTTSPPDICPSISTEENCTTYGCYWKKEKCSQCSKLDKKSAKVCNKTGCNWYKEADGCTSCNIATDKDAVKALSCVFLKDFKRCTPCVSVLDPTKSLCKKTGCGYNKNKGCVSCITLKKSKCKKNKGCDWKSIECKRKIK